jgi:hypothetical protein
MKGRPIMKKIILILACCALLAPLGFGQTSSKGARLGITTREAKTVKGTLIKTTTEEGWAANYQPSKTLVVRVDRSNASGRYVLNGPSHVVNEAGEVIRTPIKPGTRVRVYYTKTGDSRVIDHVVVE